VGDLGQGKSSKVGSEDKETGSGEILLVD